MTTPIRVLVVEDSLTVRKRLVEVIAAAPELEVIAEAGDGRRAIELCAALRPDVITLDLALPGLDGVAVTEHVMAHVPTPILVVSSASNRGELFTTYDALAAGAVDALDKSAEAADGEWERRFVAAVRMVARIKVITHPRGRHTLFGRADTGRDLEHARQPAHGHGLPPAAIAIGASTGGPGALVEVLRAVPADLAVPILVVQHLDAAFATAFADWLGAQTKHPTTYAVHGEPLTGTRGRVVLAPPGEHLIVAGRQLRLSHEPPRHFCRPSVDVLFESVARELGGASLGLLLTGMGRDGASGLLDIRRAGGSTVAQDEATCVVYGMPREAAILGAAQRVLPLPEIGAAITELARGRRT